MSIRVTIPNASVALTWEILEWHHDTGTDYYPTVDPRTNNASYDFEEKADAAHFRLRFGGKVVSQD